MSARVVGLVVAIVVLVSCADDGSGAVDSVNAGAGSTIDGTAATVTSTIVARSTSTSTDVPAPSIAGEPTSDAIADLPLAESGLEPGVPMRLTLGTHCGVRLLSRTINGRVWRTTEGVGTIDWIPEEWASQPSRPDGPIDVQAVLSADGASITASRNGRAVVYLPEGRTFAPEDLCD